FDFLTYDRKIEFIEILFDYLKYMHDRLNENLQKEGHIIPVQLPPPAPVTATQKAKAFVMDSASNKVAAVSNANLNINNELDILYKMSLIIWSWADKSTDF